jgi:hypothetical protein
MAKSKYLIVGFPSSMNVPKTPSVTRTLGAVNKKVANVEAEKGETVVTNMSRGLNNIYEMYGIGGKKHSEGGTPLALPTEDKDSDGSSFIFSDSKKMMVKDPSILDYFGIKSDKPMTFADISKTFMTRVNDSKAVLINPDADKVAKRSAEMTMDNTAFKIAALKLLQESRKGFKDGLPNGTEPFFEKLKVDPQQMFAMNQEEADQTNNAVAKAFGGLVKNYTPPVEFPSMALGGQLPYYDEGGSFGDKDTTAKKQYDYIENELGKNEKFKDALYAEYIKVSQQPDNFGKGYRGLLNNEEAKSKFIAKTKEEVFNDYKEFQKRNLMFKSHGLDIASTQQNPVFQNGKRQVSNKQITEWGTQYGVPVPNMDKATREQLSYIAFENLSKNRSVYDAELQDVMKPFGATQVGKGDEKIAGSTGFGTISQADGAYTNTTAGEISFFTPPSEKEKTPEKKKTVTTETPEDPAKVTKLAGQMPLNQPFGYRQQDLNALNRATAARFEIPRLEAWSKTAAVVTPDRAYYSPERSIAAKNEQLSHAAGMANAYGSAQAAGATAMALTGQAYADVANTISDYADKNVGVFNAGEQYNTQLANQRAQQEAQNATSMWDKNTILKQNFSNALSAAKDKITNLTNTALTNASDIYNLNLTTENFKKDPFTGLIYKANDRAVTPKKASNDDMAGEFTTFAAKLPNVNPDLQMKAFLAMKSGKYVIEPEDGTTTPNELKTLQG